MQPDRKLTLNKFVEKLKIKATSRLSKLASTSWGSDQNTLEYLYLGYVGLQS
jgi:hypothetical protein